MRIVPCGHRFEVFLSESFGLLIQVKTLMRGSSHQILYAFVEEVTVKFCSVQTW